MSKKQNRTKLIVTIILLAVTLLMVGGISFAISANKKTADTSDMTRETATTKDSDDTSSQANSDTSSDATDTDTKTVDPATLTSVDIEPLSISVFYTKGTPGFEFSIKRTTSKTQYVEFTSESLIGTKCTDDIGLFASIIKNPTTEDKTTVTATVKVGSDTYGLSLASAGCTTDESLLQQYQDGFKNGFSSLKVME